MSEPVLKQNLDERAEHSSLNMLRLLFREKVALPSPKVIAQKLKERFGNVDVVSDDEQLQSFALLDHMVTYNSGEKAPAMLLIASLPPHQEPLGDAIARTQFWNVPNGEELLDSCPHQLMLSDFMSAALPAQKRAELLSEWLEVALELFPHCVATFSPASGKLLTAEEARDNPLEGPARFIHYAVNARFFNIQGSDAHYLVDTLGLHALEFPDVQYHFHTLDPESLVRHAYNLAIYQFENDAPIESGNTVAGIDTEMKWICQYENALVQPIRNVLDVNTGEFAAGSRE